MGNRIFGHPKENIFDKVTIRIASPEVIRSWSRGEVKNPETINYRTFKPERGGLFCERIFGPTKDWECSCGKYKRIKFKGVICDRCGVEVTQSKVRRERMGQIELAVPVAHIWFFKTMPSRVGNILGMSTRTLERIIYYEDYVVVDPGETELRKKDLLSEAEYREKTEELGKGSFVAKMGAEAIRDLLRSEDLQLLDSELRQKMQKTKSKQARMKLSKRLKIVQGFLGANIKPEWTILTCIPVIPPDLRPLVPLDGGRFATSDLNDLYRRVINRNNRLKNILELKTPEVIIRNEKRMLQEAVDALFDNGRHGRPVMGAGNRPLKSLSDMLRGKQGRFRQNLLGKRVDYSGRSVIVIGPELKLNQCGLPKKMALELFEPFIIKRLKEKELVYTIRSAKKMIERESREVWDILEEVTKGHPILLNRAPTLHRLGIQAFEPVLIEGKAITVHALVCTAFNADFDGDQMAVHIPLSIEAQMEARVLMLAPNNIFLPSNGKPVATPTQDIALGCYYLTVAAEKPGEGSGVRGQGSGQVREPRSPIPDPRSLISDSAIRNPQSAMRLFADADEVMMALDFGSFSKRTLGDPSLRKTATEESSRKGAKAQRNTAESSFTKGSESGGIGLQDWVVVHMDGQKLETTPGRVIFNEILPPEIRFVNEVLTKKKLSDIILSCYRRVGLERTVKLLDDMKTLGFEYATKAGFSISIDDMIIPPEKEKLIEKARRQVAQVEEDYRAGDITAGERYNKVIDIWTHTNDNIAEALFRELKYNGGKESLNPVFAMVDSGARGSRQQIRQLAGMRGLMAKPSGEIIEAPITANFREGLSVLEYFVSTHGARKGLADTALKTADSGYLTRRLVDVSQDVIITKEDCGTLSGVVGRAMEQGGDEVIPLSERILGRVAVDDIVNPATKEVIVRAGEEIDEVAVEKIEEVDIREVRIRSALTCESKEGICAKCYGRNFANGKMVGLGEAVGIIAAQSIGEPGTQLTMRTFHIGGAIQQVFKEPQILAKGDGVVKYSGLRSVKNPQRKFVVLNKNGFVSVVNDQGREMERYGVELGSILQFADGQKVQKGQILARWDPYNVPVHTEHSGIVEFLDIIDDVTVKREVEESRKSKRLERLIVMDHKEALHPQILIKDKKSGEVVGYYSIPSGAHIVVKDGGRVSSGTLLAKTPRKISKVKDITGGLPRVAELFEARRPKDAAEIAKIDGLVEFHGIEKAKRKIIVRDEASGMAESHLIPMGKHITVYEGAKVYKGQQLTEGPVVPHEILEVCGPRELQEYLLNEIQAVYRLQGVEINDKHIEIIIRQMLRKVRIVEPGDTGLLYGEAVDKIKFAEINEKTIEEGGNPAQAAPLFLGITKASLGTDSFISAASFQDTTRVLTDAAATGKTDYLQGFKENVIMGHIIPAGTGFPLYRKALPVKEAVEEEEVKPEVAAGASE